MLKTYLYIPDQLDAQIRRVAHAEKKSKAAVIRTAIEKGLGIEGNESNAGIEVLFKLAELAKTVKGTGPRDLSTNLDTYLWDEHKP